VKVLLQFQDVLSTVDIIVVHQVQVFIIVFIIVTGNIFHIYINFKCC